MFRNKVITNNQFFLIITVLRYSSIICARVYTPGEEGVYM